MSAREEWRAVVGYEGLYEVSSEGRVRSLDRITEGKHPHRRAGQLLRLVRKPNDGYLSIAVCRGGHRRLANVHQLVAEAFLGPRPEGMDTCHNDGDNLNNRVENLRYDTRSANLLDAVAHGHHHNAKRTHCRRGHEFTDENTVSGVTNRGWNRRMCRACQRIKQAERRARLRAERDGADVLAAAYRAAVDESVA